MSLGQKLKKLKLTYVMGMPDKRILTKEEVETGANSTMNTYWGLPTVFMDDGGGTAHILRMVQYKSGMMYCYDGETSIWWNFDLNRAENVTLFPIEALVAFNEHY